MTGRHSIAIVSPFLDKRHGTERCVAEQAEQLAYRYGYQVSIYSQTVDDVRLSPGDGCLTWRRVPGIPGPHLVRYVWWFIANHLRRWWDRRSSGFSHDLVYSPGINCLDADVISTHIVFARFYQQVRAELALRRNPTRFWPRLIHRQLYYRLIMWLERLIYTRKELSLAAISRKTAADLRRFYGPNQHPRVVYYGSEQERFNPAGRARLRLDARRALGLAEETFALLLIGNDWTKKGLICILQAVRRLDKPNLQILVVGQDDATPYQSELAERHLREQVKFLPLRPDVEYYYAAADSYVGPSLEDAFALPVLEAMACGLPVVVSSQAGVSEIVSDGVDGLILKKPTDAEELAGLIWLLYEDSDFRQRLGENAARTAQQYTWQRNGAEMHAFFQEVLRRKARA